MACLCLFVSVGGVEELAPCVISPPTILFLTPVSASVVCACALALHRCALVHLRVLFSSLFPVRSRRSALFLVHTFVCNCDIPFVHVHLCFFRMAPKARTSPKGQWCMTLKEPTAAELQDMWLFNVANSGPVPDLYKFKAIAIGWEGRTPPATPELLVYFELEPGCRCRINQVRKWFPRCHVEPRWSTAKAAYGNCVKEGAFIERGTWSWDRGAGNGQHDEDHLRNVMNSEYIPPARFLEYANMIDPFDAGRANFADAFCLWPNQEITSLAYTCAFLCASFCAFVRPEMIDVDRSIRRRLRLR